MTRKAITTIIRKYTNVHIYTHVLSKNKHCNDDGVQNKAASDLDIYQNRAALILCLVCSVRGV